MEVWLVWGLSTKLMLSKTLNPPILRSRLCGKSDQCILPC